jgi:MFS family permease
MTLPRWLRALENRDFRMFWSGQLVSLTGTWMQSVAQAWLVLELTASPVRLGLIGTLQFGPFLLLSIPAGALADRLPRRRLILATQGVLMLQSVALAALVQGGHVQYWHVAALAVVGGIANSVDMPARQSFVVDLVGAERLVNAIALNSAAFNGARVVGPALAGMVVAAWGTGAAFLLNALSFVVVVAALLAVRAEGSPSRGRGTGFAADIAEGVAFVAGAPRVRFVLGMLLVMSLFVFNYNVIVPLLARNVLQAGAHGLGVLMAALGAGALTGALGLAVLGGARPPTWTIVASAAVACAATASMAGVRHFGLAVAMLYVMGASGLLFMTACNTTVQLTVPDHLRGRTMSLYTLVFVGVAPAGSLLVGWIAEHRGVPVAYGVAGVGGLLGTLGMTAWWRLARRR